MSRHYLGKPVFVENEFNDKTKEKKLSFQLSSSDHETISIEELLKPYMGKEIVIDIMPGKTVFEFEEKDKKV